MSATLAVRPAPPPAEYVGKARQFRAAIAEEDASIGRLLFNIIEPMQARLRTKKRNHRPDRLMTAAYRWRHEVPREGRLDLAVDLSIKGELRLCEWRCTAGQWKFDSWGEDARREPDLGLVQITVQAVTGKFRCMPRLTASVSLHALARHFQRCSDQSHETLRADLLLIARAHDAIVEGPAVDFRIATPRGEWVGATNSVTTQFGTVEATKQFGRRMLGIRSFIS